MACQACLSCKPGRKACMRRWSSSLIITQSDSSRLSTRPLPPLLAACSRLTRWRSTRIFLSSTVRLSIDSENAPANCGNDSTAGRICSSALTRSAFLAQPGKASPFRLRASRTRLDMTMRLCGPSRRAVSAGGVRNSWMSMRSDGSNFAEFFLRRLDFVAHHCGLFEVLLGHHFIQLLEEGLQFVGQIPALLQVVRDFADVLGSFVHGFEQSFQPLRKSHIAPRTTQPPGLLEIRLREAAMGTFNFRPAGRLLHLLRRAQAEQQIGERKTRGIVDPFVLGAVLAQIHLLHLVTDDLAQVDFRFFFFANAAQHKTAITYIGFGALQVKARRRSVLSARPETLPHVGLPCRPTAQAAVYAKPMDSPDTCVNARYRCTRLLVTGPGLPAPITRPLILTTGINSAPVPVRKHSSALNRSSRVRF